MSSTWGKRLVCVAAVGAVGCGVTVGQPIDPAPIGPRADAADDGGSGSLFDGLVAYWKLDEKGTTDPVVDSSGFGNHGTPVNGPAPSASRAPVTFANDGSRAFDGIRQYVVVGNPEVLNFEGAITLAAWVNFIALTNNCQVVVSHGFRFNPNGEVALRIGGGTCAPVDGSYFWAAGAWDGADHFAQAPLVMDQDTDVWMHLVGVYDGSAWYLYRNGKEVGRQPSELGAILIDADWAIGGKSPSDPTYPERFFRGSIDDVRIYRRALSAAEVLELYHL